MTNGNILFFNIYHKYFFNVNIPLTPVWISMKLLPVVDNTQIEGRVSKIFYMAPSFHFMIKKWETFYNCF